MTPAKLAEQRKVSTKESTEKLQEFEDTSTLNSNSIPRLTQAVESEKMSRTVIIFS